MKLKLSEFKERVTSLVDLYREELLYCVIMVGIGMAIGAFVF